MDSNSSIKGWGGGGWGSQGGGGPREGGVGVGVVLASEFRVEQIGLDGFKRVVATARADLVETKRRSHPLINLKSPSNHPQITLS